MILVLIKVTLVLTIALACVGLMKAASAAMRHLICATALVGSLLLPLTLLISASPVLLRISVSAATTRGLPATALPIANIAGIVWGLVGSAFLIRLAFGFWKISGLLRSANRVSADVYEADVSVPIACGLLHPAILLPRHAHSWPSSQRDAAIRHELAHIQRNDLWTNLIARLACAVYWFHPLVWIVATQLRHEQELACDDAVIHSGFQPDSYAEALVAAARTATSTTLITGCPMLTTTTLKLRISRLLDTTVARTASRAALVRGGMLFATALIAVGMLKPVFGQEPYKVGHGVTAPRVIYKVDPDYTDEARAAKISGAVLLKVVVGTDGRAGNVQVLRSLNAGLDSSAIRAVETWRFAPGMKDGSPVAVQAQIEVNFRLLDDPK